MGPAERLRWKQADLQRGLEAWALAGPSVGQEKRVLLVQDQVFDARGAGWTSRCGYVDSGRGRALGVALEFATTSVSRDGSSGIVTSNRREPASTELDEAHAAVPCGMVSGCSLDGRVSFENHRVERGSG